MKGNNQEIIPGQAQLSPVHCFGWFGFFGYGFLCGFFFFLYTQQSNFWGPVLINNWHEASTMKPTWLNQGLNNLWSLIILVNWDIKVLHCLWRKKAEKGQVEEYMRSNFAALSGILFYLIYHILLKNKPYLAISVEH